MTKGIPEEIIRARKSKDDPINPVYGQRLREIRKAKDLTQTELAGILNAMGQAYLAQIELGHRLFSSALRDMLITKLEVNPAYIDHGDTPMFKRITRNPSSDAVVVALATRQKGNMHYVGNTDVGGFLAGGTVSVYKYMDFPFECYNLPVENDNMAPAIPRGARLICTVAQGASLRREKAHLFQTETKLIVGLFNGYDEAGNYCLKFLYGEPIALTTDEVKRIYLIEQVIAPPTV